MSGEEPPGKPTTMRIGFVGHVVSTGSIFKPFCALAQVVHAQEAIKIVATASLRGSACKVSFFMPFAVVDSPAYSVFKSFVNAKAKRGIWLMISILIVFTLGRNPHS
jgi:hypothetical protein